MCIFVSSLVQETIPFWILNSPQIKKIIENLSKDFGAFRPKKLFWSCKGKMFRELDDTPAKFMVLDHTISKFRGPDFMSACHIITREEKMVLESGFGT